MNSYMDERLVEDQFKRIETALPRKDKVLRTKEQFERNILNWMPTPKNALDKHDEFDWSIGPTTKSEFEHILTQLSFVEEEKSLGGFELMKVLENLIESFLQILVVLAIFIQPNQEGLLNKSIFAFSSGNEEESLLSRFNLSTKTIFTLTSMLS